MKTLYLILLVAITAGCSKSSDGGGITQPETITDTVGRIWLTPVNEAAGWDTTGNYCAGYHFSKGAAYTTLAYYIASSSGTYRVRYVGAGALFHPDSVISRGGSLIDFKMNNSLRGQAVFEIYNISTGALYKRYIASSGGVVIRASFSIFDNFITPNKTIGEAMLYYINVKQNDGIKYRKN